MSRLTVVVPVRNEELNIQSFLIELEEVLKVNFVPLNVLFIDDGSRDKTVDVINKYENSFTYKVSLIKLGSEYGQGMATYRGVQACNSDLLCLVDGDLQYHPRLIIELYIKYRTSNVDYVRAVRSNRCDPLFYSCLSKAANLLINYIFKVNLEDIGCTLKLGKTDIFKGIDFFEGYHRYVGLILYKRGFTCLEQHVRHHRRAGGRSKYSVMKLLSFPFDYRGLRRELTRKSSLVS